jgi:PAS domain S-box-containing protein
LFVITSTSTKVRLVVGAGVAALLLVGGTAIGIAFRAGAVAQATRLEWRIIPVLVIALLLLALVLAWFAYANLQRDLTERSEAETALRASEAKFAGILDIAADAIISVDDGLRVLHFNRGAERIFGYAASEMLGRPLSDLLPRRYRDAHDGHVRAFGRSADPARQMGDRREIFGLRRDGTEFPAEASISKLEQRHGAKVYTVLLRDVSERKQREEAQRRLSAAVATLGETLEVEGTERAVVQLPVPWLGDAAMLDVVAGGGQLRRFPAITGDEARDAALAALAACALDLDSPSRVVDVLRTGRVELVADASEEWMEAHTVDATELARMRAVDIGVILFLPLVAREHVLGVLKIIRRRGQPVFTVQEQGIAEALALRAAFALDNARLYSTARAATHARDHALGVVSHDLRNPISAIGMSARALRATIGESDVMRGELIENILSSQEMTQRMIRDLLDVASIEVGRLAVERRSEPVAPILERAVGLFTREAADRGIALTLDVTDGGGAPASATSTKLPAVHGDAERLVQVLSNLLANALRYTARDGRVSVSARSNASEVEISVADTGSGIPAASLPLIFERYWTVRGNSPKGGTGLGLAIARGIVEAHGGRLWAESEVGKGSTFRFTLRAAE